MEGFSKFQELFSNLRNLNNHYHRLFTIMINSAMLGTGITYIDREECEIPVIFYLRVAGGVGILINSLELIVLLYIHGAGSPVNLEIEKSNFSCGTMFGNFLVTSINVAILVWGSIVVFVPYQTWNNKENEGNPVCDDFPYLLTFVMTITGWVLLLFRGLLSCCAIGTQYFENRSDGKSSVLLTRYISNNIVPPITPVNDNETSQIIYEVMLYLSWVLPRTL